MQPHPSGASTYTDPAPHALPARQQLHRAQASRHTVESTRQPLSSTDIDLAEYPSSADLHTPLTGTHAFPRDSFASTRRSSMSSHYPQQHQAGSGAAGAGRFSAAPSSFMGPVLQPARNWFDEMRWGRDKPKVQKRRRLQLFASYAPDWIITLILAGSLAFVDTINGFQREFSLTDTSLQHTHALEERVTVGELVVYTVIIPAILVVLFALAINRSVWDLHAGLLCLFLTHALNVTATTLLKVTVGRPRPDVIDRCRPRAGAENASPFGLVTSAICTADPTTHEMKDGWKSFPSGHSSTAFAGLTFLALYFAGKVHLMNRKGHAAAAWVVFFPMIGAALIAVSRTMDYRHHATDVIAGGILGFLVAVGTYGRYYPSLYDPRCHKPWGPRIAREDESEAGETYDIEQRAAVQDSTNARVLNAAQGVVHEAPAGYQHARTHSAAEAEMHRETVQPPQV